MSKKLPKKKHHYKFAVFILIIGGVVLLLAAKLASAGLEQCHLNPGKPYKSGGNVIYHGNVWCSPSREINVTVLGFENGNRVISDPQGWWYITGAGRQFISDPVPCDGNTSNHFSRIRITDGNNVERRDSATVSLAGC